MIYIKNIEQQIQEGRKTIKHHHVNTLCYSCVSRMKLMLKIDHSHIYGIDKTESPWYRRCNTLTEAFEHLRRTRGRYHEERMEFVHNLMVGYIAPSFTSKSG